MLRLETIFRSWMKRNYVLVSTWLTSATEKAFTVIERHTMKSFEEYRICIMYYNIYYLVGLAVISMADGPSPPSSFTVSQLHPRPDKSSSTVDFWQQSLERGRWSKAAKSHR